MFYKRQCKGIAIPLIVFSNQEIINNTIYFMHSFSENSKGEEALLHPQNTYSQVIQKKDEGVDKKCFLYIENAA